MGIRKASTGTKPYSHLDDKQLDEVLEKTADKAEYNRQVGNYLFWGATSIMALTAGTLMTGTLAPTAAALGVGAVSAATLGAGLAVASLGLLAAGIYYSRKAANSTEQNDKAYSTLQARDMADALENKQQVSSKVELNQKASKEVNEIARGFSNETAMANTGDMPARKNDSNIGIG